MSAQKAMKATRHIRMIAITRASCLLTPFSGRTPLALLFRDMEGFNAVAEYLTRVAGTS
jgi:hypothetical protein